MQKKNENFEDKDVTELTSEDFVDSGTEELKEDNYQEPQEKYQNQEQENPLVELEEKIPDKDYFNYAMDIVQRTVKQDPSLVKQIMYTGLSAFTKDPINLLVSAPTSEGKTYPVVQTLKIFPKQNVWLLGSITPKVIIRQSGVLVDGKNEPIQDLIKELKKIFACAKSDPEKQDQAFEAKEKLEKLIEEAKVLIDLNNWIFVFLEPPHPDTWAIMKPIMSHDDYEIEHPYVYDVQGMGFRVKKIVTRGWPAWK